MTTSAASSSKDDLVIIAPKPVAPKPAVKKKKKNRITFLHHETAEELKAAAAKIDYDRVLSEADEETQAGYDLVQALESNDHCKNPICSLQQAFCLDMMLEGYFEIEDGQLPKVFKLKNHCYQPAMYSNGLMLDDYVTTSESSSEE